MVELAIPPGCHAGRYRDRRGVLVLRRSTRD